MSNRAANERAAIEQSVAMDKPRSRGRAWRSGDWCSDHEMELKAFFSGAQVGAAGLRSSLGAQLDRMKDGLGAPDGFDAHDIPPELRGADTRAAEVAGALARVRAGGYEDVLRAQYAPETAGRLQGFEALTGGEAWQKAGLPDLRIKLADRVSQQGEVLTAGEVVTPLVAIMAIAADLAKGKAVGTITPDCPDVRARLRRICLTAGVFPAVQGAEKPKKAAITSARDDISHIGWRAKKLLTRAQRAYAKARSDADKDELDAYLAALAEGGS